MNYKRIYNNIIKHALNERSLDYSEKHHIIPKCMGGTNNKENLVILTAREHYLCHFLLAKHYNYSKLWLAYSMMVVKSNKHKRWSSRDFEKIRKAKSIGVSGKNNPMYGKQSAFFGKTHTEESKEKIRISKFGKKRKPFKRGTPTEETKLKMSKTMKQKKKLKCEFCGKETNAGNFAQRHGTNCKNK